jgi:hypothetical protein
MKCQALIFIATVGVSCAFVVNYPSVPARKARDVTLFAAEPKQVTGIKKVNVPTRSHQTPAQRFLNKNRPANNVPKLSEFEKLKSMAYAVGDGILSRNRSSTKKNTVDKYATADAKQVKRSPTQQLLHALMKRQQATEESAKTVPPPRSSVFDSVKGVIYGTAELASTVVSGVSTRTTTSSTPLQRASSNFKVVVKSRKPVNSQAPSTSANPIERLTAEWKQRESKLQKTARDKINNDGYTVGDFLSSTASDIRAAPHRLQSFVASISVSIASTKENAVGNVASVKKSVDGTGDKTRKVVEDVKATRSRLLATLESTKETMKSVALAVDEMSTSAKIGLGLEQPKPQTTNLPLQTPVASDVALQVAGNVLAGAGKAFLWVRSGAADLAFTALRSGVRQVNEGRFGSVESSLPSKPAFLSSRVMEMAATQVAPGDAGIAIALETLSAAASSNSKSDVKSSRIDLEDETLDQEIAEALQLANEALSMLSSEGTYCTSQCTGTVSGLLIHQLLQTPPNRNDTVVTTFDDQRLSQEVSTAFEVAEESVSLSIDDESERPETANVPVPESAEKSSIATIDCEILHQEIADAMKAANEALSSATQ